MAKKPGGKKKYWLLGILIVLFLIVGMSCDELNPGQAQPPANTTVCEDSFPNCDGSCDIAGKECMELFDLVTNETFCGCAYPEPDAPTYTCETTVFQTQSDCYAGTCPPGSYCDLNLQGTACTCWEDQEDEIENQNDCGYDNWFYCTYPDPDSPQGCYSDKECCFYVKNFKPDIYPGSWYEDPFTGDCVTDPFVSYCPDGTCQW